MAALTEQQAQDIGVMMANVEAAHKETVAARTALSALLAVGRATCGDVRAYNLNTKAVYAYQASVAGIIRANGGDAPVIPPPLYIAWRGVAGDQAVDIDCNSAQMRGLGAPAQDVVFLDSKTVEWRPGATTDDVAMINQVVAAGNAAIAQQAGLGLAPLAVTAITIVLYGLFVVVAGYIAIKLVEAIRDVPSKRETTRQIAIQAVEHRKSLEQRAACYNDCTTRGRDPVECAKACDRLVPGFKPALPAGGLGIVGTIAGVAILGLTIYASWRFVAGGGMERMRMRRERRDRRSNGGGRAQRALPSHRDAIIDAAFTERAA